MEINYNLLTYNLGSHKVSITIPKGRNKGERREVQAKIEPKLIRETLNSVVPYLAPRECCAMI